MNRGGVALLAGGLAKQQFDHWPGGVAQFVATMDDCADAKLILFGNRAIGIFQLRLRILLAKLPDVLVVRIRLRHDAAGLSRGVLSGTSRRPAQEP